MPLPAYLYYATPPMDALVIAKNGLQPKPIGDKKYLSMTGAESQALTLRGQASDIIFRVAGAKLNEDKWEEFGGAKKEWRSTESVPGSALEYRRNMGSPNQKTWRAATHYPQGMAG